MVDGELSVRWLAARGRKPFCVLCCSTTTATVVGWLRSLLEENCRTVVEELNGLPRWTALGNGGGTDLGSNGTSHGVIVLLLPRSLRFGLWTGSVGQQSSCLRRRWRWLNWVINIE